MTIRNKDKAHIFLVDDDSLVRDVITRTLLQLNVEVMAFACASDCLEHLHSHVCDLLITDVKMKEIDGIQLLKQVKQVAPSLPVIVITGYGDVPMAVQALKLGACEFIEKPIRRTTLFSVVESTLNQNAGPHPQVTELLSKTEADILRLILEGKNNKEIASLRNRSPRTIEDHRRHIMQKLGADNLVELVKRAAVVRITDLPSQ